jgi:hypothetical protein
MSTKVVTSGLRFFWSDPVFIDRVLLLLTSSLLLAGCAGQAGMANLSLGQRDVPAQAASNKHQIVSSGPDDDGTIPLVTDDVLRVDVGKRTVDHRSRSRPSGHENRLALGARKSDIEVDRQIVYTATTEPSLSPPNKSHFLDRLVEEDEEMQKLKRSTIICRGC